MVIGMYFCSLEKMRNVKMWSLLTQRAKRGSRQPSVRGKEEKRLAERQRVKVVEREKKESIDKLQTACGCTDTSCDRQKKRKRGKSESIETEGVKDSQPEKVTEHSPERARVCG